MKKHHLLFAVLLLLPVFCLLLSREAFPGWEAPDILTASQSRRIRRELAQAADVCQGAEDRDMMEARLIDAGFATVDSDAVYPAYLANADALREFAAGGDSLTVVQSREDGGFAHLFFARGKENFLILTEVTRDGQGEFSVSRCETLPLYEAELADWDVFYYRCYPANDPHYSDYNCFRLTPADRELYDLTLQYILPVGYRMVNLFLVDWQAGDWGGLSLNDVLEYLYEIQTGAPFPWQEFPAQQDADCLLIPAQLFEDTVLPFFPITREQLRELCRYDEETDSYPWRPVHGDDLTTWGFSFLQPEVTDYTENPDGTLTLTVQAASSEWKTNRVFTHEVTVRPLQDGGFQYVANRVTCVSSHGLPPSTARLRQAMG